MVLEALFAAAAFALLADPCRAARTAVNLFCESVEDLERLPQDPAAYLADGPAEAWLAEDAQAEMAAEALRRFFSPWHAPRGSAPDMGWTEGLLGSGRYAGNLRPWTKEAATALTDDSRMDEFPSLDRRAVAVRNTNLRAFPTDMPAFADPRQAGEGFPFDALQVSAVWAGTPLRVRHANRRGDWLLCETPLCSGWLREGDAAFVSAGFVRRYERGRCAVILDDSSPLRDSKGRTLCAAHTGAVFPLSRDGVALLVPVRTSAGTARIVRARAPERSWALFPLAFTAGNAAAQARKFIGAPYGWGGMFGARDCSATMRDLLFPFGFDLPRNSAAQARAGTVLGLSGMGGDEKIAAIRARGVPFRSLIGMKGHIGLYLGLSDRGEPAMLHTLWGVRLGTEREPELEGRLLVGRTVITTLRPGAEKPDIISPDSTLERVHSLTLLPGIEKRLQSGQ